MGPQQQTAPLVKSWPDREKERLNAALYGRWEVWYVPVYQPSGYAWSRPSRRGVRLRLAGRDAG